MLEQSSVTECPVHMDDRLARVETEVREVSALVSILDERQQRMHDDFRNLTLALQENTKAIGAVNNIISNRKGFVAGVITVITLLGGILAAVLGQTLEWFK